MTSSFRLALGLALVCLAAPACAAPTAVRVRVESAVPLPAYDAAFRAADPRWRGADANISVPLAADRILWLFGDSWITKPDAKGREGGRLARNTLAIQPILPDGSGKPEFHWQSDAKGEPTGAFVPDDPEQWHWPLSGLRLGPEAVVFLSRLHKSGDDPVFNFAGVGNEVAVVADPDAPPARWSVRSGEIPFFTHSKTGDRCFGLASVADGPHVFVYGIREDWTRGFGGRGIILARTSADALRRLDFSAWEFWDGAAWVADIARAADLFDSAAAEMSVSWLPGPARFVAVYTSCGLSDEVVARLATRPEGPWSAPVTLFKTPEMSRNKNSMTYAGKAHPELARGPWELVVTYAHNSRDFADHFKGMELYWPRFYRVTLATTSDK